jgi:hypothetical protein
MRVTKPLHQYSELLSVFQEIQATNFGFENWQQHVLGDGESRTTFCPQANNSQQ